MVTVECIPYRNFKEKIQITKELSKQKGAIIETYSNYIYVEIQGREGYGKNTRRTIA